MKLLEKLGNLFKKADIKKVEAEKVKIQLNYIIIPNFKGMVAQEAVDWCKNHGLKYEFTNLQPGWRLGNISIAAQSPDPGSKLIKGKVVKFTAINQVSY